jgi:hypothetical protein
MNHKQRTRTNQGDKKFNSGQAILPRYDTDTTTTTVNDSEHDIDFDQWLQTNFEAADPTEQDWCLSVFRSGTYWKKSPQEGGNKGAQFSQDVFIARRLFRDYIVHGKKGVFVEAGANHYQELSSSYFFEKCLGWTGLCIEPQKQYHRGFERHRSCQLVPNCLSKEHKHMMIGGMPAHRGAGMFVRPIPADGNIPTNFERIDCAPLQSMIPPGQVVDLLVLDVEGAEMIILDTIAWDTLKFRALLIETEKMNSVTKLRLKADMQARGYRVLEELRIDTLFVTEDFAVTNEQLFDIDGDVWEPPGNFLRHASAYK